MEFVAQHQDKFYLHWYIMYLAIPMYNYKTNYGDLYVYEFLHEMNVFLSFYLNIFGTAYKYTLSVYEVCVNAAIIHRGPL